MKYFPDTIPEIDCDGFCLKKLKESDADDFVELARFKNPNANRQQALELIQLVNQQFKKQQALNWGMYQGNELLGTVGYYRGFQNDVGEVGYVIREKFRRKGFTLKGARAAVEYGFTTLGLQLITAYTRDDNLASQGLLLQLGFQSTDQFHEEYRRFERQP